MPDPQKPEVTIYTDGACVPNPGPGGWACILVFGKHRKELSGYVPAPTTNNRCEMGAVIEAFRSLKKPCKVKIITDARGGGYTLESRNKKPKKRKNPDLVEKMLKVVTGHELTIEWIRGHAGHPENEKCDQLAGEALRSIHNPTPEYTMPSASAAQDAGTEMALF
jgi:ribonuclease HI